MWSWRITAETLIAYTERIQNETKPLDSQNCADQKHAEKTIQLQRCVPFHEKESMMQRAEPGAQREKPRNMENYSWSRGNRGSKPTLEGAREVVKEWDPSNWDYRNMPSVMTRSRICPWAWVNYVELKKKKRENKAFKKLIIHMDIEITKNVDKNNSEETKVKLSVTSYKKIRTP